MRAVYLGGNWRKEMRGVGRVRWGREAPRMVCVTGSLPQSTWTDWAHLRQWDPRIFLLMLEP